MNSNAARKWKERNRPVEAILPTGTKVEVVLVDVPTMLKARLFPDAISSFARTWQTKGVDLNEADDETLGQYDQMQAAIIARGVVLIDGEPVDLTADDIGYGDTPQIRRDDRDYLWGIQTRMIGLSVAPDKLAEYRAERAAAEAESSPKRLTLADVAAMVAAEGVLVIDELCVRYGLDVADVAEIDDPFLAWQFRLGLLKRREAAMQAAKDADPRSDIDGGLAEIAATRRTLGIAS